MDAETESDEKPEITAAKEVQSTSEEPTCIFQLDDWDKWFGPPSPSHLVLPDSDPNICNVQMSQT